MQVRNESVELLNAKLLVAIRENKLDEIKSLIMDGADLAAVHDGKTPIEYAASLDLWACVVSIAAARKMNDEDTFHYTAVLKIAAEKHYDNVVRALLSAGVSPDTRLSNYTCDNGTLLHWAITNLNEELVKELITLGADLSALDAAGSTPMICAKRTSYWNWNLVELIAKAKRTDANDTYLYRTALLSAVTANREYTVRCLLEAGTKPDCIWATGDTPLHEAVRSSRNSLIATLIEHGADLGAKNKFGQTPLQIALSLEKWDVVEAIVKLKKTTPQDDYGYNAALLAAEKAGRKHTVDLLLAAGAPATGKVDGVPLLHRAIDAGDLTLIGKLIANGADLAATDSHQRTAMDHAVYWDKWKCVEKIAQCKPNDDKDTFHYGNALVKAVRQNRGTSVNVLLHANAMSNSKNNAGLKMVLHTAIYDASENVVLHLAEHGADLAAKDNNYTPMQHLAYHQQWNCMSKLAKSRKTDQADTYRYGSALECAVYVNRLADAKTLLEAGASAKWKRDGQGVLHRAVLNNNVEMLELLLKYGAKLSDKNADGKTPMELAVELMHPKCAAVMIKHATDLSDSYHYGQALLYIMQKGCSHHEVNAFIQAGACNTKKYADLTFLHAVANRQLDNARSIHAAAANIMAATDKQDSVLHLAVKNNDLEMLRFLLEKGALQTRLNRAKQTPVELAAELGHWDCVQLLLEFQHHDGNNKQVIHDLHLEQALLTAIQKSHYAAAKLLLEHHAPLDKWSLEFGNIALYWAVKNNERNPDMVTLLLEHGADATIRNKDGKTIADVSKEMRHIACAKRLVAYSGMVKPGKSAEEYRQDVNELYQQLSENAMRPEGIPEVIRKMGDCYRALLQSDLQALQQRREILQQQVKTAKQDTSALSLLNFSPENNEIKDVNSLIMVINTILNFPDKIPSPQMIRKGSSLESNDVAEYLTRKSLTDDYLRRVRSYLQNLNSEIQQHEWKVKTFLGTWIKGMPAHIKLIRKELDRLSITSNQDEIYAIFAKVVTVLNSIDTLEKRHEDTIYFYQQQKRRLSSMSFIALPDSPLQDIQAMADKQRMSPRVAHEESPTQSTYVNAYPRIVGDKIVMPTPVPQSVLPPPLIPQVAAHVTDHVADVSPVQQPVPSAPAPEQDDAGVVFPDVPDKPIKSASQFRLYQQPAATSVEKDKPREKRSGGKVALLG